MRSRLHVHVDASAWRRALLACATLLAVLGQADAQVTPAQRRCLRVLGEGFMSVATARAMHGRRCLTSGGTALASTRADCLAVASDGNTERAARRTTRRAARSCPTAPPFGATDAATVIEAATARELLLPYDLFGSQVDHALLPPADDTSPARCQRAVLRRAQRRQVVRYRQFAACMRRGLRDGSITNGEHLAACIDVDPRGRIATACGPALQEVIAGRCATVDPATAFPGCQLTDGGTVAGCLGQSLACGACLALEQAGGLALACDRRDDGFPNATCVACPPAGRLPDGQRLHDDLVTYVGFGVRRTGTAGAAASATWLAEQLGQLGFTIEEQPFPFTRFDWEPARSSLIVDGRSYDFVPLWFPTIGSASGELGLVDGSSTPAIAGKIALVFINERILTDGSPTHQVIRGAIDLGAVAVVAVNAYRPEAVALNVSPPFDHSPWPVPVVIVGERHRAALEASIGKPATVEIAGTAGPATAVNVVARVTPSPGKPTFVVSTPYTGWFTTAAERGPGIALFLGLARWVAERRSGANYVFVAFAGMELGTSGERAFLDPSNRPPLPDAVGAWLHLGAGIVTYGVERDGDRYLRAAPEYGVAISTPGPVQEATRCGLDDAGRFLAVPPAFAGGSLEVVFGAGYRAFGLQTTNDLYHTAEDVLGRNEPDAALLQPVAVGLVRALTALGG